MYVFIINPTAGSGRAERELPRLQKVLEQRGLSSRVCATAQGGDAASLAAEVAKTAPTGVIAVGGDGTISEIAGGLRQTGVPLIFAACGTGNDFVRTARLPKDIVKALEVQLDTPPRKIDMGLMNDRCFLNVAGTGLDVDVLVEAEQYKENASGIKPYLKGVAAAINRYRPITAELSWDGSAPREELFTILSIGNGQYFGGGMRPVPDALLDDGLFDVVMARPVRKWQIPFLMALFIPGLHAKTALVKRMRVREVRIRRPGMVVNLDGELLACDDAHFRILPGALTVRLPGIK